MLTNQRLREVLDYEPGAGVFRWKALTHPRANCRIGEVAGATDKRGFTRISIDGRQYSSARLAVFWQTGTWPSDDEVVDRADRNPNNTSWSNLRSVTKASGLDRANSTRNRTRIEGLQARKGVYRVNDAGKLDGKVFRASITVRGRTKHLGRFRTREEACRVYLKTAEEHFGEFACDGRGGYS
jgi:hypothetical protein